MPPLTDMAHLPNGFGTWSIMKWSHFICFAQFYHSIGPDRDFDMGTDRKAPEATITIRLCKVHE